MLRAFTDQEIEQPRERIQESPHLLSADLVAGGLRPQGLIGLRLKAGTGGVPVAVVRRAKVTSKGASRLEPESSQPKGAHLPTAKPSAHARRIKQLRLAAGRARAAVEGARAGYSQGRGLIHSAMERGLITSSSMGTALPGSHGTCTTPA